MMNMQIAGVRYGAAALCLCALAACGSDSTGPSGPPSSIVLTSDVLHALDSSATAIKQANPDDPTLRALVDSTLLTLTAGVEAKRVDVTTGLTSAPMYFVAVHRAFNSTGGKWATWSVVGFDDPAHLGALLEVSGYAAPATSAPTGVSGAIGDGTGVVNGLMLRVGSGGAVTEWIASSGPVSFAADSAGAECPGFTATSTVTCALEPTKVNFSIAASSGSAGADSLSASIGAAADVPGIRLTYTP